MKVESYRKSCIVFAPHEDDATFGCGGTILSRRKAGVDVYVVCLTDGRNSHLFCFGMKANPSPFELAVQREKEEKQAMQELKVDEDHLIFLRIEDSSLFKNRQEASKRVAQVINELRPSEVFIPYKDDKHPDHIATHMIVRDCLTRLDIKPSVFQYFVWAVPNSKTKDNIVIADISKEMEAKKAAISHYESQITCNLYPAQDRPVLTEEFVSRFNKLEEVFILENTANLRRLSKLWLSTRLYFSSYYFYFVKHIRHKNK